MLFALWQPFDSLLALHGRQQLPCIQPQCDNKRGNYALKESKLASIWSNACGFNPKTTARGKSAVAWKASGTEGAGNFSAVMYGVSCIMSANALTHKTQVQIP